MTEAVSNAVEEIKAAFPDTPCVVIEDNNGGVVVILEEVSLGPLYSPETSWVGFGIGFQYPSSDVYPHFLRNDLSRTDGRPLGDGIQLNHTFQKRPAMQLSRKSNRWNPQVDTALIKLQKVLQWFMTHP